MANTAASMVGKGDAEVARTVWVSETEMESKRQDSDVPGRPPVPRVLMLVENSAPADRRVWQECLALREAGYDVSVVCPRGDERDLEPFVRLEGVDIHRYELRTAAGGTFGYLREYVSACLHAGSRSG